MKLIINIVHIILGTICTIFTAIILAAGLHGAGLPLIIVALSELWYIGSFILYIYKSRQNSHSKRTKSNNRKKLPDKYRYIALWGLLPFALMFLSIMFVADYSFACTIFTIIVFIMMFPVFKGQYHGVISIAEAKGMVFKKLGLLIVLFTAVLMIANFFKFDFINWSL